MKFQITSPAKAIEGADVILYGPPKCGKTSTLDDPKLKILHIDLEGGSAVLYGAENVSRINVPEEAQRLGLLQFEVVVQIIKAIETGELSGFDAYALDSLTQFEDCVKEYIVKKYAPNRKREIEGRFGAQSDWGDLKDLITTTVKRVHALTKRGENSVHWIWIAHVAQVKDDVTERVVRTRVQLQGSNTAEVVMSIVDAIFYMSAYSVETEENGQKRVEVERAILTKPSGPYVAEYRVSKRMLEKGDVLPRVIKNPVWSDIFEALGYVRK